jgi:hypothetical protein
MAHAKRTARLLAHTTAWLLVVSWLTLACSALATAATPPPAADRATPLTRRLRSRDDTQSVEVHGRDLGGSTYSPLTLKRGAHAAQRLEDGVWASGSCSSIGEVVDFYVNVSDAHAHDNLLAELIVDETRLRPGAVTLRLYANDIDKDSGKGGSIPGNRFTERTDSFTIDNTYSLTLGAHEIVGGARYYISVTCNTETDTSFGIAIFFSQSALNSTQTIHGA